MLLVEQVARRCESPLSPAVLSSALTFTNRQLRRRVHLQPNAAWPSVPNFGLQMLLGRCHFLTPASTPSPVLTRVVAEWARLLKVGGRLLFTDPITLTGPLTNAEMVVRRSAGVYLFVPHGYDEFVIAQRGLRLLVCEDLTANMAKVAEARRTARGSKSAVLREIEGDQAYDGQQELLGVAARIAREGRLSRFVYVSERLS
jgi:hypothetical protein